MTCTHLFFVFAYIGLCAVGGGMATIPLIQQQLVVPGFLSAEKLLNMIAISESTPGPIGVNIATYVGFDTAGILGAVCATAGLIFPSLVIIVLIARFFSGFQHIPVVKAAFFGLRAAVVGLIASAAAQVLAVTVFHPERFSADALFAVVNIPAAVLFVLILAAYLKFKKHPVVYILAGALYGVFFL